MRVVEDITRFVLDEKQLYEEAKNIRLTLGELSRRLNQDNQLLSGRDVEEDVGTGVTPGAEIQRENLVGVVAANLKRTQEALRVLEEVVKLVEPDLCIRFKELRYRTYALEKRVLQALQGRGEQGEDE